MQINIVAGKSIPYKTEPKYKPIFASCDFVDGRNFKTLEMPQQPNCKWNQKHVFLLGSCDAAKLREQLATQLV